MQNYQILMILIFLRIMLHYIETSLINDKQKQDKSHLYYIVIYFQDCCLTLSWIKRLSIDEQMIPFSARRAMRQYVSSKTKPVEFKFVLAAQNGLVLDFVIYMGADTVPTDEKVFYGLGEAIIRHLVVFPLLTHRFSTDIPIPDYLSSRIIFLTGTVMSS